MLRKTLVSFVAIVLLALPAAAATVKMRQNRTPMRAEPTAASLVVAYYQAGDLLELVDVIDGWYKVRDIRTRQEGYVLITLVELLPGSVETAGAKRGAASVPAAPSPGQSPAPRVDARAAPAASRWTDIGYIAADGAYQGGTKGFSETFSFPQYVEQATITTQYPRKDGPTFNVGGAFRLWRGLGVGVGVSLVTRSTNGAVTGTIPHPFFFRTDRPVSGTAALRRTETGAHLQAAYVIPAGGRVLVAVGGGPSFFSVKQSLVDSVKHAESYPYDTTVLQPVETANSTRSVVGYNAGLDVGYYFTRVVGVGVMARYAAAKVSLPSHGSNLSLTLGGFQAGVGLRIRIPKSAPKAKPVKPAPPPPARPR